MKFILVHYLRFHEKTFISLWGKNRLCHLKYLQGLRRWIMYIKKWVAEKWNHVALNILFALELFSFSLKCFYGQFIVSCFKNNYSAMKEFYHLFLIFLIFVVISQFNKSTEMPNFFSKPSHIWSSSSKNESSVKWPTLKPNSSIKNILLSVK